MTKHTPGPWIVHNLSAAVKAGNVRPGADGTAFRITADRTLCIELRADSDGYVIGENAANARLIAAAPELLQALETICKHANEAWAALDHNYHEVLAGNLGDAVDQARAVIAKAKGESAE